MFSSIITVHTNSYSMLGSMPPGNIIFLLFDAFEFVASKCMFDHYFLELDINIWLLPFMKVFLNKKVK